MVGMSISKDNLVGLKLSKVLLVTPILEGISSGVYYDVLFKESFLIRSAVAASLIRTHIINGMGIGCSRMQCKGVLRELRR